MEHTTIHHTHHGLMGDYTTLGLLLVSNTPTLLSMTSIATEWLQIIAMVSGIGASAVVFVDHTMKITWKIRNSRKEKKEKDASGKE